MNEQENSPGTESATEQETPRGGFKFDVNDIVTKALAVIKTPGEYFRSMPTSGGYVEPLIFAIALSLVAGFISAILSFVGSPVGLLAYGMAAIIFVPIGAMIGLFIGGGILFLIWKVMGSEKDYEASVRCMSAMMAIYPITAKTMMQIGRELGVANILEGGIQRAGNRVRINMQLIDAATDRHLWAETYDREMTAENLFSIQSEIAREVVLALNGVLSEQDDTKLAKRPTTSLAAYGEFVLGRQAMAKRTVEAFDMAIVHFEKAIELDPDYAMAKVGLANSIQLKASYSRPRQDIAEVSGAVQSLIDKALSLDPMSGEAWASLGLLRKTQGNNEEAEKYYLRAIELSPNYPFVYLWYSNLLNGEEGGREQALQYIKKATELDPLADILKINLANILRHLGRMDENLNVLKQGHASNPDFFLYYPTITTSLTYSGQIAEALRWAREGSRRAPNHGRIRFQACELLMNLAADQQAEQCLLKLIEDFPDSGYYVILSDLYSLAGERDKALNVMLDYHPAVPGKWHEEMLAIQYLVNGKLEKASDIVNSIAPQFFSADPVSVSENEFNLAILAIFLLKSDGRLERADALGHALLEIVNTSRRMDPGDGYHLETTLVHAAIGDRPGALAALREAIDSGWRMNWRQLSDPLLDHMRQEPEWNAMMAELEADIERQREWFLAHRDDPLR